MVLFNFIKDDAVRVFKRTCRRKFSVGLVLVLAGIATSAGLSIGASPAYAYDYLSVDSISASNVSVASYSCRDIPVRFSISSDGLTSFSYGSTSVFRNSDYIDSFSFLVLRIDGFTARGWMALVALNWAPLLSRATMTMVVLTSATMDRSTVLITHQQVSTSRQRVF